LCVYQLNLLNLVNKYCNTMPNLRKFVDTLNKSNLHAASSYVFDWPEVFPSIENIDPGSLNRFGHAVIQNVTVTGVDHT